MTEQIELESVDLNIMYPNEMLLDYLNGKSPMRDFFNNKPENLHPVRYSGNRSILKETLLKYNKSIDAHDNVLANIETVEDENVKFVITGQQPGLLTGPLYTIYKTFSAINYAKYYSTEETKLIPLFWNASEDHDVEEVNNIWILNRENDVVPVQVDTQSYTGKSLENLSIEKEKITHIIEYLIQNLPQTEFTDEIFQKFILDTLNKSQKWGEFFSRMLSQLMKQYGLILIEPKVLRPFLTDYFTKLISDPIHYNNIFLNTTQQLTDLGYKPKMHKKENIAGLFYIDDENNRNTITLNDSNIYEMTSDVSFTKEEILNEIQKRPERFSTNAIFRPLAQDTLFPTYIFVGGPSEIGYHIQIKDLYKEFNLQQPNLHFRMGATMIERHINRILEKYNFKITELKDLNILAKNILQNEDNNLLAKYFTQISSTYDDMQSELTKYNQELGSRVENRKNSIMKELSNIEKMYLKYVKDENQILTSQLEKAKAFIFPSDKPQERIMNIFQYLNKYSFTILECMRNLLSKNQPGKHVILKCWMF
ncbi:MAG: bacillithiol biosynthesis cysteine-adding enzyme BshC [Candidatus Thorarchaeota archaeon]